MVLLEQSNVQTSLLSRAQYEALVASGAFEGRRVELIEGEIIEMAPIGDAHEVLSDVIAIVLRETFGQGFIARNQVSIALGPDHRPSAPQPDVTIATGTYRDYLSRKPGPSDIYLIVEIADSSLATDRAVKGRLYASVGIPEYWIVNLIDVQLEVYREPSNSAYTSIIIYKAGDTLEPLGASGSRVSVSELLP